MKPKQWLNLSVLLIIVGGAFLVAYSIVCTPRFEAFRTALETWTKEHANTTPPNPASYGLQDTAFIVITFLGSAGSILVFIGACYLAIYFVGKIAKRLGYTKEPTSIVC